MESCELYGQADLNGDLPDLSLSIRRITDVSHQCPIPHCISYTSIPCTFPLSHLASFYRLLLLFKLLNILALIIVKLLLYPTILVSF
jgi:hypothetical protein